DTFNSSCPSNTMVWSLQQGSTSRECPSPPECEGISIPQLPASEKSAKSTRISPQKCLPTVMDVVDANTKRAMPKETIFRNAGFIDHKFTTFSSSREYCCFFTGVLSLGTSYPKHCKIFQRDRTGPERRILHEWGPYRSRGSSVFDRAQEKNS